MSVDFGQLRHIYEWPFVEMSRRTTVGSERPVAGLVKIDSHARAPLGTEKPLSTDVRARLIAYLRKQPS